ncbi:MAG: FecR family protein [Tannerellaceae bacterium]|nr:FecR family protein [Tannerellaceae bacterium]
MIKYAAIIVIPLITGIIGTILISKSAQEDTPLSFGVAKGNKGFLELADGSKVWLNSGSTLVYGLLNPREVLLEGEAYFEIKLDVKNKFKVRTSYFDIVVYGTSFNVSTYQGEDVVEVDLLAGSIGIVDNEKSLFKLEPGQAVLYNKQDKNILLSTGIWQTFQSGRITN